MSVDIYELVVSQYTPSFASAYGKEHWALVAIKPPSPVVRAYQIKGNRDSYCYTVEEVKNIMHSGSLSGGSEVGEIRGENLPWLDEELKTVEVVKGDTSWNCQSWVIDAIRKLQDHPDKVTIARPFEAAELRSRLREEYRLWNRGEDHCLERLIPPENR